MGDLAPLLAVFAIYLPALLLPGPDFLAVARSSLAGGPRHGLLTATGVALGLGLYATLSLLGLSAILTEFEWLAWAVRIAGGSYLVWLGIRLLLTRRDRAAGDLLAQEAPAARTGRGPLLFGLGVTLTNPKAIVLFASVFATSMTAASPPWLLALTIALVTGTALGWYALVSLTLSAPPVLRRLGRARHWIERIAGACFVAIGGRILADARNPLTP